jgi:N6-L-threonylcarbamoyladenine synthase
MLVLGIESSCDDTAAAVLNDNKVLSNVLSSQNALHAQYGGVVPELASRRHVQAINPIVAEALTQANIRIEDVELIAATQGPGLIGSLLVGFSYAKALSYYHKIPIVGVDHMAGHILSIFLENQEVNFPFIALIASGGTTSLFRANDFHTFHHLGRTRDDAAGEAFDKVAKLLDLPYPGGPHIAKMSKAGDPAAIRFPRAWLDEGSLDFSFSGVKTAVLNHVTMDEKNDTRTELADICASFQEAVVDVLVTKTLRAVVQEECDTVVIGGGVAANERLRTMMASACSAKQISFFAPSPGYCTDNAAMIGLAGSYLYQHRPEYLGYDQDVYSRSPLG